MDQKNFIMNIEKKILDKNEYSVIFPTSLSVLRKVEYRKYFQLDI